MTVIDLATSSDAATPAPARRRGLRLPGSRGGALWLSVLLILGALLAFQFGKQVYANWETGQRQAELQAQIAAIEDQNTQLKAELNYLQSRAFVEPEARRLENVGRSGEQVLIIPPGAEAPLPASLETVEPPKPLLEQWMELFFGGSGR